MRSKAIVVLIAFVIVAARAGAENVGVKSPASYVKVKLEVELRGVLSFANKEVTIRVQESEFDPGLLAEVQKERKWTLDLGRSKGLLDKAKGLDGKIVIVKGSATLLGINTQTLRYKGGVPLICADKAPDLTGTRAVLNLEHKVEVRSLTRAPKD
jgi:hypothetical protein